MLNARKQKNELERRHLEAKKQEASHWTQISSLTWNKNCTRNVFRKGNKSSKVELIYLEVWKQSYKMESVK